MVHGTYDIKIRYLKKRSLILPFGQKFYSLDFHPQFRRAAHGFQIPPHHPAGRHLTRNTYHTLYVRYKPTHITLSYKLHSM